MSDALPTFATEEEAFEWMYDKVADEDCVDGIRFAYKDDPQGLSKYQAIYDSGCCGYFDHDIIVGGRPAEIGCNYGH